VIALSRFYTPEQALSEIVRELNDRLHYDYKDIVPAGSVPLGLYVDDRPDLDVFIVTYKPEDVEPVFKYLRGKFKGGRVKDGELDIWHLENYKGYPVDLVVIDQNNNRIQTLNHLQYYRDIMTDDMAKRIRWLKTFFKTINCYGAEVGGITGICCTRMAELHDDTRELFNELATTLMVKGHFYVEDPTLEGRDLFASVRGLKKRVMIREITNYLHEMDYGVTLHTFFEDYRRVYKIRRKRSIGGVDKEWQFVYSCLKKSWRSLKNATSPWNVKIDYDTLVTEYDIYVGVRIDPDIIEHVAFDYIPLHVLKEEDKEKLLVKGAYESADGKNLVYPRMPPFKNVSREFERVFMERLQEKYNRIERE
jgi:hypothetical protein